MRLSEEANRTLDREVERSGRYPATIVSELILVHLAPERGPAQPIARDTADAVS